MKKIPILLCTSLFLLSLSACSNTSGATVDNTTPTTTVAPIDNSQTEETIPTKAPIDVPSNDTPVEVTPDTPVNEPLSESRQALLNFQEEILADEKLCAVAYLGTTSDNFQDFYSWLETADFFIDYPFLAELTEANTVLSAGEEWYAIIPADNTLTLTINELIMDETTFELKAGSELLQTTNGNPILLRGNISDLMPNLLLTVTKDGATVLEYSPSLSLRDGYMNDAENIYDFTNYDWFMEADDDTTYVTPISIYAANSTKEYIKENVLLSSGNRMTLRLNEADAALYPCLADEFALKTKEDLDELKSKVQILKQLAQYGEASDYFDNCSLTVLRADEQVVSIRYTYNDYSGGAHPNSYITTVNYDPELGGWYALEDIFADTTLLLDIIEEKLFEKYPAETFFAEKGHVLENYTTELLTWTLDYQGITFHFGPYSIAPYSEGSLNVTIWFDEFPDLFYDEYTYAPEKGHAIPLFNGEKLAFDRNLSDHRRDTVSVIPSYDTISIYYNDSVYQETEFTFDEVNSYLVCTGKPGNENYFLYLELLSGTERTLCIYELTAEGLLRTEVLYQVTFDSFQATEAEEELTYTKLLTAPLEN